ncbi:ASCH domain-containing protein [Cupriavidus pinatubonensis]|uniref:ASCH domain-containing protein n=1 Tax=Cupriavidus pinatubonensis TaxID=248026 RepID=A0ABN7Y993_9BURK|nr:ASCH domain-containing protein [Cupriavidus pinatubonensis]CAG9169963.1 hypothetical protein LMG23994_01751 [Cupriavidus pinatubonensis]
MKALSIRQWAWLIVRPDLGGDARNEAIAQGVLKDIENRTWPTHFRGRFLVHAAKGMTRYEYEDVEDYLKYTEPGIALPKREDLEGGGIVGVATIADCVPSARRTSRWHMEGQFGFQIADAKALPFVPCKGELKLFTVPVDVAAHLRAVHGARDAQPDWEGR